MVNVLIVEDEVLIADRIAHYLHASEILPELNIVGPAASYQEAADLLVQGAPDLALIDIRLYGAKSGIDVAKLLRSDYPDTALIFLTSQFGNSYLQEARALHPSGYLLKPIDRRNLCATVLLSLKPEQLDKAENEVISLYAGTKVVHAELKDLLFVEADHVYVNYHFANDITIVVRQSLAQTEEVLTQEKFVRVHRSFIVNREHIAGYSASAVRVNGREIPISRSRRAEILGLLA